MQRAAERAVADHLSARGDPSAAVVAIDPATGAIRAMVGGKNFGRSQVNLATYGHGRQAGSAFKPFTLAAAMEDHISLNSYWYGPNKITITDPRCNNLDGTPWQPSNAADEGAGAMSLTNATAFSVNTIFAQLVTVVGPDAVVDVAKRMGITHAAAAVLLDHARHPIGPPARHDQRVRHPRRARSAPRSDSSLARAPALRRCGPLPGRPGFERGAGARARTTPTS